MNKFKLTLVSALLVMISNVNAEPIADTAFNATASGALQSVGSTVQNIATTWNIPVNPEAKKSVETVHDNFKDNPTAFKSGSTIGDVAQVVGLPAVAVTVRTTKVTVIGMELTKDSIKAGEKYIEKQMKDTGLSRSLGVEVK